MFGFLCGVSTLGFCLLFQLRIRRLDQETRQLQKAIDIEKAKAHAYVEAAVGAVHHQEHT